MRTFYIIKHNIYFQWIYTGILIFKCSRQNNFFTYVTKFVYDASKELKIKVKVKEGYATSLQVDVFLKSQAALCCLKSVIYFLRYDQSKS